MSILKILGKVGAVAAGGAALFLAGKSGLGESLFSSKEDGVETDDLEATLQPTPTETEDVIETPEVETTEQEGSD